MKNNYINDYLGHLEMTIVEAMQKIDVTGAGILFVVDMDNRLVGTLTDGDIRRWLIKTGNLNACISELLQTHPIFLYETQKSEAKNEMQVRHLRAIPILNAKMQIVDIIFNIGKEQQDIKGSCDLLKNVPVVIMAGGKGTRLLPYTNVLPKPLIPVGNKPIIERIIEQFRKFGCNKFYLILNYKKNMIKAYFNEEKHEYNVEFIDEEMPLGTGGGLSLLKNIIKETFILSNCDVLIKEDFSEIYNFHVRSKNMISMICSVKNFKIPYGIVHTGINGVIESMEEKPTFSFYTNTGCYIVEPTVLNNIPDDKYLDFPQIIDNYIGKGCKIGAYPINESAWLDMGQLDEFEKMKKNFEDE